ncbi:MAG: helix-turn-helix transcriptional regulator [Phreatobacter sp.]|uniref:helix-turn-helix domain-containing protein n=1 Tax=Phreatobacter sp. TaxID=1966341 RepID=UPI001A492D79|nr:helix-turn-helix transcriptional regulator [Phreatobacter sp.]MBL8571995.1 helix-turn-helix transcriptional regulator [Phreatobacter sp.]
MSLASRIKETREARGMSMTDLAGIVDVTTSAVSTWESGRSAPRPAMLAKIAKALGVKVEFLNEEIDEEDGPMDGVEEILQKAKEDIANVLGASLDRVKLDLHFSV